MVASLFVIQGNDQGKRFELAEPWLSIGRDASNPLRLHDTEVSRRHAELRRHGTDYELVDLASSNGTFVNQQRVQSLLLKTGDHIQLGQTTLVYSASSPDREDAADLAVLLSGQGELRPPTIVSAIDQGQGKRLLAQPEQATGPWLARALANLSVMYQTAQAVSHILDTDQLLERIMDLVFDSIPAERGCIMLRQPEGNGFVPRAVRFRSAAGGESIGISRTIMEHVLREGQGVLVTDAVHDDRFARSASIVSRGIREAVCAPMRGRHETVGVIYLDSRAAPQELARMGTATASLTEDHLKLAIAIGHQAALALEESRYYQALLQAERLAAVGQTIAAISHHVKNILQGLRGGSDLLRMGIDEKNDAMVHQGWTVVEKNQRRIYDLVMDMLSYSKDREPALETMRVDVVIREVLELVEGRIREQKVELQLRNPAGLPAIQADAEGIHRALLNLVGNALDALAETENPRLEVDASVGDGGGWMEIAIRDNGPGIPAERLPELFKPFASTKGSRGTGLGLAVSRKILREHGGDIVVASEPGRGSTFTLRLPLQAAGEPDPAGTGVHPRVEEPG